MADLHGWTMAPWACVCGRTHAAWWRTTPPPSCPHGWPDVPPTTPAPVSYAHLVHMFGGPLTLPGPT